MSQSQDPALTDVNADPAPIVDPAGPKDPDPNLADTSQVAPIIDPGQGKNTDPALTDPSASG